jgi:hypothetical protein
MTQQVSPSRLRQLHHALPPPHQRLSSDEQTGSYSGPEVLFWECAAARDLLEARFRLTDEPRGTAAQHLSVR